MDNRRKYDYITNANEISINSTGITLSVDPPSLYTTIASRTTPAIEAIQVAHISPGDVILLRISDNIDVHGCAEIMTEMKQAFPCNQVLLCNDHVLKDIFILRPDPNLTIDIDANIDIDKMFSDIMKGNPNDFLH